MAQAGALRSRQHAEDVHAQHDDTHIEAGGSAARNATGAAHAFDLSSGFRRGTLSAGPVGNDFGFGQYPTMKLRFERRSAPYIEPLMGWTSGDDTLTQVELAFPSAEAAIAYVRR